MLFVIVTTSAACCQSEETHAGQPEASCKHKAAQPESDPDDQLPPEPEVGQPGSEADPLESEDCQLLLATEAGKLLSLLYICLHTFF